MHKSEFLFTSESVSEGHPDKICDRVSDAIVDLYLAKDNVSRLGIETLVTTNLIVIAGETRCSEVVTKDEIESASRGAVKAIGYDQDNFHWVHSQQLMVSHVLLQLLNLGCL